jgi:Protein of unknown function (DUF2905)
MDSLGKLLLGLGSSCSLQGSQFSSCRATACTNCRVTIVIHRGHFTIYLPLGLMILLSLVLTIVLNLVSRR